VWPWVAMAGPPARGVRDDGPALLDKFQKELQMDDEWIVRTPRSLTWWGHQVPMTFTVDEPRIVQGDPTIKLTVRATVLRGVAAPTSKVLDVLDGVSRHASVGAFVWLEQERRIDAFLVHYHYEALGPITHLVTAFALQLYGEAVARAPSLAETLDGLPNVVPHPASDFRMKTDELLLHFHETHVAPAGLRPSKWHSQEFEETAGYLMRTGIGASTACPDGLSATFPLAQRVPGTDIRPYFSAPTASGELRCLEHPTYKAGADEPALVPAPDTRESEGFGERLQPCSGPV
jgi:hypothetical protein